MPVMVEMRQGRPCDGGICLDRGFRLQTVMARFYHKRGCDGCARALAWFAVWPTAQKKRGRRGSKQQ